MYDDLFHVLNYICTCVCVCVHVHAYGGQPIQASQGAESIILLSQIQRMRYRWIEVML